MWKLFIHDRNILPLLFWSSEHERRYFKSAKRSNNNNKKSPSAHVFTLSTAPRESPLNLWTHQLLECVGHLLRGFEIPAPLSASADPLPAAGVTPPTQGLVTIVPPQTKWAQSSCLCLRGFFSTHNRRDTRSGTKSKCQLFPGDWCKNSHFEKRTALTVLTDNRLGCRRCISRSAAQPREIKQKSRTQLKALFLYDDGMYFTCQTEKKEGNKSIWGYNFLPDM